jgi:putative hemolysin
MTVRLLTTRAPYTSAEPEGEPVVSYAQPGDPPHRVLLVRAIERLTGQRDIQAIYSRIKREGLPPERFFRRALDLADIEVDWRGAAPAALPASGPLIFVANHPFGIVDGLALCDLAVQARGDFKVLLHALLCRDADLERFFLPVDFSSDAGAPRRNIAMKRAALAHLANDGALVIFPSGGIATARRGFGALEDLPWSTFVAKLVQQSRATVVPVFFHGRNSRQFHVVSQVSLTLRLALLLHETRRRMGARVEAVIGEPIAFDTVAHIHGRQALTRHLHRATWSLGD